MTILLKENSEEVRQKILDAGVGVCVCASFEDACWLDFHTSIMSRKVHGVGYYGEEVGTKTQEEECERFLAEARDLYVCKDVDEFIILVKLTLKVKSEVGEDILRTIGVSKQGYLEYNFRELAKELKGEKLYD